MTMRLWQPAALPALLLALAAGASNVFAFAPFGLWPVQIATLALLFHLLLGTHSTRHAMLLAWTFGFGWLTAGVHWLYISMHVHGGMPSIMAAFAVALLAAALALLFAVAAGGAAWLRRRLSLSDQTMLLAVFPAIWLLAEWVRGWLFTGFPWIVSGYAHTNSPLAGFAPVIGVYGLGWLAALIATSLLLWRSNRLLAATLPVVLLLSGFLLTNVQWTSPSGEPISVRLLQGNVPQEIKFNPGQTRLTLMQYEAMIHAAPADLIVTPETALPLLLDSLPADYMLRLKHYANTSGSHIALGIPVSDDQDSYANSVIGISPASASLPANKLYRYDKHHLVPFGEFIPPGFRWFVDMMHIPLGDFTRGSKTPAPFQVKDQWVLPNICYEDLFGEEIAAQLRNSHTPGAPTGSLLLNLSNIAWFGDSIALPQHLQISQMRALETGRPMLRATNTGATAVINPRGEVEAQLPFLTHGSLAASVQGYQGMTPYIRFGNAPIIGIAFLLLIAACLQYPRRHRH